RLGKGNHVANGWLTAEECRDAVEAEGDPAVGRCAVLQRIHEEAESQSSLIIRDPQQLEDEPLQRLIVYPDAAAADLAAVEHEIVGACACAPLIGFQQMPIALERSGERMMHELVALLLLEPLEHRKVHDPE